MKQMKMFKKILIIVLLFGFVFGATLFSIYFVRNNFAYFNNVILSLTILDDDGGGGDDGGGDDDDDGEDDGDDDDPVIITPPSKNGGSVILKINNLPVKEVQEDFKSEPSFSEDAIVVDIIDSENGISLSTQSDSPGVAILDVPVMPSVNVADVLIPISPTQDLDVSTVSPRISFSGFSEPNSYVLLEIFSSPRIVTLFTNSDGKWKYDVPSDLSAGLHHVYVWAFSADGNVKSLVSSRAFIVDDTLNNSERTELLLESGVLKSSPEKSHLISHFNDAAKDKIMIYLNGRVLDVGADGVLKVFVFVNELIGDIEDYKSGMNFSYKIYDENNELISQFSDDYSREFKDGVVSFVKPFDLSNVRVVAGRSYKLLIESDFAGLHYSLPLDFKIEKDSAVISIRDVVFAASITVFLLIIVYGAFCIVKRRGK